MELRHLRYFVAVAEDLSFTKAAGKLHLAQPSLTRQIHNLEEELGVRLLNRSKSQVTLTEEGRSFLADARRILALATESVLAVQRLSRGEAGQLNISYLSNFDFELLPETLRAFRLSFPHIALNLFDMTPAEQLRALEARKIDLGFVGLPPPATAGAIQWESIARHRTVVVLPAKHSLAGKRQLKLGELESMFFVGMSEKTHPGFRDMAQPHLPTGGLYAPGPTGRRAGNRLDDLRCRRLGRHPGAGAHQETASSWSYVPPAGSRRSRAIIALPGTGTTIHEPCTNTLKSSKV